MKSSARVAAVLAGLIGALSFAGWWTTSDAAQGTTTSAAVGTAPAVAPDVAGLQSNTNGQTIGTIVDMSQGRTPDLVLVVATNGTQGYVRSSDMDTARPPAGRPAPDGWTAPAKLVPVYTKDGLTIVGEFKIG